MFKAAIVFSIITIVFHISAFVHEAFLITQPVVAERIVSINAAAVDVALMDQIEILKVLFFNQGFYNLFLALGGVAGLLLLHKGKQAQGLTLLVNMCCFAVGAGLILSLTTTAYPLAFLQAGPPLTALIGFYFWFKRVGFKHVASVST